MPRCWRGTVSGLKAPSGPARRGRGVVPRRAEGSSSPPVRRGAGSWGGLAGRGRGQCRGRAGPRGSAGLVSCVASRPSRPFSAPLPRISWTRLRRQSSFLWTPGVGCLRVWGVQLTFPGSPGQNEPGWAPTHRPGPGPLGRLLPGCVRGMLLCAGATAPGLPSPRVSSRRPLGPSLSFRPRGPEAGVGDASGAGGQSEPREAGGRRSALRRLSPARTIAGA